MQGGRGQATFTPTVMKKAKIPMPPKKKECIAISSESEWEPTTPPKIVVAGYSYSAYLRAQCVYEDERAARELQLGKRRRKY